MNLCVHIVNGVRALHVQSDDLPGQDLHKDMYAAVETQHQVEGELFLDVILHKGSAILDLFTSKDELLLVSGNSLLVLDLGLDVVNDVQVLHLQGDGIAGPGFNEDLHATRWTEDQMES